MPLILPSHPIPIHRPIDFGELIDEEFDSFDKRPFHRKPLREFNVLLCDDKTWEDTFDNNDMLYELEE